MKIKIHIIKQNSLNFPGFPGLSEPCYHQLLGRRKLLIPQGSIFSKAFPPMDSVLNDILIYTLKLIFVWYFRLWWPNDFIGGLSYDQCLSFPNDSILKLHQATLSWIFYLLLGCPSTMGHYCGDRFTHLIIITAHFVIFNPMVTLEPCNQVES